MQVIYTLCHVPKIDLLNLNINFIFQLFLRNYFNIEKSILKDLSYQNYDFLIIVNMIH
jgi:hypothetical protein